MLTNAHAQAKEHLLYASAHSQTQTHTVSQYKPQEKPRFQCRILSSTLMDLTSGLSQSCFLFNTSTGKVALQLNKLQISCAAMTPQWRFKLVCPFASGSPFRWGLKHGFSIQCKKKKKSSSPTAILSFFSLVVVACADAAQHHPSIGVIDRSEISVLSRMRSASSRRRVSRAVTRVCRSQSHLRSKAAK